MKNDLIIISGPTACGKTEASIKLAQQINGEIISADSMQVYKFMDIGTAKIKKHEMEGINHYMIDEIYPNQDFSVAKFKEMAKNYIHKIYEKDKIPILVGGTGFYINSIIYDNNFEETYKDTEFRKNLEELAINKGNEFLHKMLKKIDEESSINIHKNNVKKVIRAIEFFKQTGKKISQHNKLEKERKKVYNSKQFVFNMERSILYERINLRVDLMVEQGLLKEVENLLKMGYTKDLTSMQGIGYKEIVKYFNKELTLEEAVELIKKSTRNFAKRQLTWFKTQCEDPIWVDVLNFKSSQDLVEYIKSK